MNEEIHWDKTADNYASEVLNVFHADKGKKLRKYFDKYADKKKFAIDFGCGVGNGFPYLSPSFNEVLALDISSECLAIAKKRGYKNISFKKADLTSSRLKLPAADFGICVNVLLLPKVEQNRKIIRNVRKALKRGAHVLFVMPSMESMMHVGWSMIEWYKKEGLKPNKIPRHELSAFKANKTDLLQGIIDISGVPTKHYLQTEIEVLFRDIGFTIVSLEKIEYDWKTEFDHPPKWLKAPYPWDWLLLCKV